MRLILIIYLALHADSIYEEYFRCQALGLTFHDEVALQTALKELLEGLHGVELPAVQSKEGLEAEMPQTFTDRNRWLELSVWQLRVDDTAV